jgi:hypothetical protein
MVTHLGFRCYSKRPAKHDGPADPRAHAERSGLLRVRSVRDAAERGAFDDLPGAGKPLPALDQTYDELWWIKQKMAPEGLSHLPPTLVLRKEADDALVTSQASSGPAFRRIMADINGKINQALRKPLSGPPLNLAPFDVDRVVRKWREMR